jgi:hypothetical protein
LARKVSAGEARDLVTDWFENDALFFRELQTGHEFACLVAERLGRHGLHVEVTPMEVRNDIADRGRFSDEHDLTVGVRAPCRIDVKSRELSFRSASDYPYSTAFVDTTSGWGAKAHRPHAIVLVSQRTKAMLVISVRDSASWKREWRYDNKRGISDWFWMVDAARLRPFDDLVTYLVRREGLTG